ncbi:uncharacterized protein B0J16DRAFT_357681 [Fusarium flagelliforme]|uniref:uncharacterized protein n=1 Tax=Fusarium flagelliforme TaxID=2675880 RepID=UPI001E8EA54C|nr:uncharacterized protein B0J16DRAFT_357681 [Fusarium flagelliforme]KAH7179967.1 hypothetical protein B0J16DRAFT_357681 [Fusarium flagelliforme]
MADGLSVASSVIALVAFAFKSSTVLYTTIRNFQSQDKNARALKNELADLQGVLHSLAETVSNNNHINFNTLKLPLLHCRKTCNITNIRETLARYKSTINIALPNANMRVITSITSKAFEEYKDTIHNTTNDLREHINRLDERLYALAGSKAESFGQDEPGWITMLEEKQSTQEGLKICLQLSAQIKQLKSTSREHPKIEAIRSAVSLSKQKATQFAQLQETKESIRQCMRVVADAGKALGNKRCNIFEDITITNRSYGISVSTVKDLVVARRISLSGQARYLGSQISDESYQRTIDGLTQLDIESVKTSG